MAGNPNKNILDRAFEEYCRILRKDGKLAPDEASFVGGFMTCFGIITGRVDIGLDQNAPLTEILDEIHRNIADYGIKTAERMAKALEQVNGYGRE